MTVNSTDSPRSEYRRRLDDRQQAVIRWSALNDRIATWRGIIFLLGIGLVVLVRTQTIVPAWSLLLPVSIFFVLIALHSRVVSQLGRAKNAVAYYERALARLDDNWAGTGPTGERYRDATHTYADDLDLFGTGSLFQLISTARTRLGEDRLAGWLLAPADVKTARDRQTAVDELRPLIDLREEISLLDAEVHDELDQNQLLHWAQEAPQPVHTARRITAVILALLGVAALVCWLCLNMRASGLIAVLILQVILAFTFRRRVRKAVRTTDQARSGLAILSQVLNVIEARTFRTPQLEAIRNRLDSGGVVPSVNIHKLDGLIQSLHNCLQNQFFAPIAFLLGMPVHLVHSIEEWRAKHGPHIADWLDGVAEFEALSALAGYAYEHPSDPFPDLVEEGPCFAGTQLGHPLLPEDRCIRNDLELGGDLRLMLVSGSNMSGKSTLLRTIGTNVVLALAGAPVRAEKMSLSQLNVGTAMRVHDSLQDGKSLFYAVLTRLKSIVELTDAELPLLFLLDEILQGTNSHDRRVGAEGIIRKLADCGAVGLVTTHDLALTDIVDSLGTKAINVHFEDHLVDGKMTFDYQLRPGVVEKSNALELMRMMGLNV